MNIAEIFSLSGKTALIAGASRGIGLAIAKAMAQSGAKTVLAARSVEILQEQADTLNQKGLDAAALRLDMADPESIRSVARDLPDVDILVNVTGTNIRKPFEKYTDEDYEFLLRTNLDGIVRLTQEVGGRMVARGMGGKVITIGSLLSVVGLPYLSIYSITKSALAGMTRSLAAEWGPHNIQVNCIAPGFILTDLNRDMWQSPAMDLWRSGAQAIPRMGTPEDIAPLAVFLAGPGSDFITGQLIAVDGGYTTAARWPFAPEAPQ
jgi:gluconate 5-dehydrogenase